jgi:hypothetical protein
MTRAATRPSAVAGSKTNSSRTISLLGPTVKALSSSRSTCSFDSAPVTTLSFW